MQRRETREIGKFPATGTDGRTYTIVEFRDFIHQRFLDNTTASAEGLRSFRVLNGGFVNSDGGGDFTIVATGMKVKKAG